MFRLVFRSSRGRQHGKGTPRRVTLAAPGTGTALLRHVNTRGWLWVLIANVKLSAMSAGDGEVTAFSTQLRPSGSFIITLIRAGTQTVGEGISTGPDGQMQP